VRLRWAKEEIDDLDKSATLVGNATPRRSTLSLADSGASVNLFTIIGRYFWLLCLGVSAYNYIVGMSSLASRDPTDPRASVDAIALRRWFAIYSALPWAVMGWGIIVGGVPNIWYYFRPQDRNPFVLVWFAAIFLVAIYFAFWVFLRDGAQKVVLLQPFEVNWYRTSLRGTTRGTISLTEGRVKLFAALGPIWIAVWTYLVSLTNVPLPK
jgi:hypothetical protein